MQKSTKIGIAVIAALVIGTVGGVYAITTGMLTLPSNGVVTNSNLQASPNAVDWGTLALGSTATRTINLTNTAAANSLPLNLTTTQAVGAVSWNAEDYVLLPHQTVNVTLTLTVAQNATVGPFEFPLYITG